MELLKNIACVGSVVIFIVGICAVANRLLLLAVRPRCGEKAFTVILLDGETKNPTAVISYYLSVYSVSGGLGRMKIICVDRGLPESTLRLLRDVFRHEKHIVFVSESEYAEKIVK